MKFTILCLICFFLINQTLAKDAGLLFADAYFSLGVGFGEMDETIQGGEVVDHNETIYQTGLGTRMGLNLFGFNLGAVIEFNRSSYIGKRADEGGFFPGESEFYSATFEQMQWGAMAGFRHHSGMRLWGEYYPKLEGKFTYSDNESGNPFQKSNQLFGSGWGVGAGLALKPFYIGLLFRQENYEQIDRLQVRQDLGGVNLTQLKNQSGLVQLGFSFN